MNRHTLFGWAAVLSLTACTAFCVTAETPPSVPAAPRAELVRPGKTEKPVAYATLTEAFEAAEHGDTIVLKADSSENLVLDKPRRQVTEGNNTSTAPIGLTLDLNGKTYSGTLSLDDVRLRLVSSGRADGAPPTDLPLAGLTSARRSESLLTFGSSVRCDLSGVNLSGYVGHFALDSRTDLGLTLPVGWEIRVTASAGILSLRIADGDPRLTYGYCVPALKNSSGDVRLTDARGTVLSTFTAAAGGIYNPNVDDSWNGSGICDLSTTYGWGRRRLPGPNDRVAVYLPEGEDRIRAGNTPFKVAGMMISGKRLNITDETPWQEAEPTELFGTFIIGEGKGELVADTLLEVGKATKLQCGKINIGKDCYLELTAGRTVSEDLSGPGTLLLGEPGSNGKKTEFTLTGNNTHARTVLRPQVSITADRISNVAAERIEFGHTYYDYGKADIHIVIQEDTDERDVRMPAVFDRKDSSLTGTIRFSGTGCYTLPAVSWECDLVNDLSDGIMLPDSLPKVYEFQAYNGDGGFRLCLPGGTRRVIVGNPNNNSAMPLSEISTLVRPLYPDQILANETFFSLVARGTTVLNGNYREPWYSELIAEGSLRLKGDTYWNGNLLVRDVPREASDTGPGRLACLSGSGVIGGSLHVQTAAFSVDRKYLGAPLTVNGSARFPYLMQGPSKIYFPNFRNSRVGQTLLSVKGGIERSKAYEIGEPPDLLGYSFEEPERFGHFTAEWTYAGDGAATALIEGKDPVASVGGTLYTSLTEAFDAVKYGETVRLETNTYEDAVFNGGKKGKGPAPRFNLNGKLHSGSLTILGDLTVHDRSGFFDMDERSFYGGILGCGCDSVTIGRPGILNQNFRVVFEKGIRPYHTHPQAWHEAWNVSAGISDGDGTEPPVPATAITLHGGDVTLYSNIIGGNAPVVRSTPEGNANLTVRSTAGFLCGGVTGIRWEGTGRLNILGGWFECCTGIEMFAGELDVRDGHFACYGTLGGGAATGPGVIASEVFGVCIAVLQKDPDRPVRAYIHSNPGPVLNGENYAFFEHSVTEKPSAATLSLRTAADASRVWPDLSIAGGELYGGAHSESVAAGMPGFVTGGSFIPPRSGGGEPKPALMPELMAPGYAFIEMAPGGGYGPPTTQVYPKPPKDSTVSVAEGMTPLTETQQARMMMDIGKLPDTVKTVTVSAPNSDMLSFLQTIGIAPGVFASDSLPSAAGPAVLSADPLPASENLTVVYAPPKLDIIGFAPETGDIRCRLTPDRRMNNTLRALFPNHLLTLYSMTAPDAKPQRFWGQASFDGYMDPDTLGEFSIRCDPGLPSFFRVSLIDGTL